MYYYLMYLMENRIMKRYSWYNYGYSEFEVQAIAYGILRKNLYPKFIVRGEYSFNRDMEDERFPLSGQGCRIDIAIFLPGKDKKPPKPILLVEVKKGTKSISDTQGKKYTALLGVPCVYIRGKEDAYNALEIVQPFLTQY